MPTQQKDPQPAGTEELGVRQRNSLIGKHVIQALGPPEGLHRVQIRPLWGQYFRVNVLVGPDAVSAKVVHSYFLAADSLGKILTSTPVIVRHYGDSDGIPGPTGTMSTVDERSPGG
jgi:hypothetical protein